MVNSEEDLQSFEALQPSGYAAAELLFLASAGDCAKAKAVFDQWCQSGEAQAGALRHFIDAVHMAQSAIEQREGQPRKAVSVCDLAPAISEEGTDSETASQP